MTSSSNELAANIIRKFSNLTFASARQAPQVSGLRASVGRDTVKALANLLTFTASQFNVTNNLSNAQVALLANDLLKKYWHWRFDEFAYVLGQALRGKWGTVFNRIDAAVVNEWCEHYGAEREALLTLESEEQAKSYKLAEGAAEAPSPATSTPAARALRQQLASLSNDALQAGLDFYQALPDRTPEQELKLAVATEEAQERNRISWAAHMLRQFRAAGVEGRTQAEREADARESSHALEVALLRGDWQAAGFSSQPSAEWLAALYDNPQAA